ncbi:hypothetical protein INR77_08880 [Erythrobacter sp. SCSIO 43205]|uniref:hypothetical protein n=1 Tax=Erythrobacter sp. SCSIO 43205 TaxID=2779361 RepID=UPI001CAA04A2|nr:hypothetical protein [Erythrobacter sp. SCSIO 43205]UAB76961.1 hypothetical protein INR77_08880 [Erythrobacter sp. SCSIO 43205]
MPTIELSEPWTYRTPLKTQRFPAGTHDVSASIAQTAMTDPAAKAAIMEQETADGSGDRTPRKTRRTRKAKK